jgi:hypothetical protein
MDGWMDGWMDDFIYPDPSQKAICRIQLLYISLCKYKLSVPLPENELRASLRPIVA